MNRPEGTPPAGIPAAISKADVLALPIRRFQGEVRLVATPEELTAALADIRAERVTGFDTETRPAFVRGQSYLPALAQVATARAVYLFQLRHRELHAPLGELLSSPGTIKAGVALADDLQKLRKLFPFEERAVVDLGILGKRRGLKQSGVRNLAALLLGWRLLKGAQTTNWAARDLSKEQLSYAATDAWICRELHLRFEALGMAGA